MRMLEYGWYGYDVAHLSSSEWHRQPQDVPILNSISGEPNANVPINGDGKAAAAAAAAGGDGEDCSPRTQRRIDGT